MNTARIDIEREDGQNETVQATTLPPVESLFNPAFPAHATVSMSVGTQVDFGRVKVTAHVSYQCDQTNSAVDRAGLMAFEKAVSFMNDGVALLTGPAPV